MFEATPFTLVVPARPRKINSISNARNSHSSYVAGEFTASTNFETAQRNWSEIIERHLRRFHDGEVDAVYRLLDINIEFIRDARVLESIIEAERTRRKRGKPMGRSEKSQTIGVILVLLVDSLMVDCPLVDRRTGQKCRSREAIFDALATEGFEGLEYDRIKQLYYQFRNDTRLAPYLIRFDELTQAVRGRDLRLVAARERTGQEEIFEGSNYKLRFYVEADRET